MAVIQHPIALNSITLESTNFQINDDEFKKITEISKKINKNVIILFWQFTIKTLDELEIVSNQHLSIEMFLLRLVYLSGIKPKIGNKSENFINDKKINIDKDNDNSPSLVNNETINQIKNITQEQELKSEPQPRTKAEYKFEINSFDDLIKICNLKKEIKLKLDLEKNVNLVKFEKNRIEISFNDNLNKNFVKDLSTKLFDWTGERWIISFSKNKGDMTIKEKQNFQKVDQIEKVKKSDLYKSMLEYFSDAKLVDVKSKDKNEDL